MKKRDPKETSALSTGIFLAIIFLAISLLGKFLNLFPETINLLMDLYGGIGYDLTYFGILLGIVYGFITGFILCWFYNLIYTKLK
jgi:hypothetical protein